MFTNTLPQNAKNALAILGKNRSLPENVYLAGGSALALQYGHRISVDFDFFTPTKFHAQKIAENLAKIGNFTIEETTEDTLLGDFEKVRFSLFLYQYPLIVKPLSLEGIAIASAQDIGAMKLAAIMDRGTKKDFVDLYFLAKKGISLENSLKYYDQKYQALTSNIYSLLKSLTYFIDAEKTEMPIMLEKVPWEEIMTFFEKETVRLAKIYL